MQRTLKEILYFYNSPWLIPARVEGTAILSLLGVIFFISITFEAAPHGPWGCLFKAVTHLPCPSCGMTRAFIALGHGDICSAIFLNPSSILVYSFAWIGLFLAFLQIIYGKKFIRIAWTKSEKVLFPLILVLMSCTWVYKLIYHFSGA